jgi:hypothetical protein
MKGDSYHDGYDDEYGHEEAIQAALVATFRGEHADLSDTCEEAGMPALLDACGGPVAVARTHTYRDAGVLTFNRGVVLDLSDGSQFQLTIAISRRPNA